MSVPQDFVISQLCNISQNWPLSAKVNFLHKLQIFSQYVIILG